MAIATPLSTAPTTPWRRAWQALGVLLLAILLAYGDTYASMVAIWSRSGTFAHAFLVPPIVVWLVWRQRDLLALQSPRFFPWALLPMAVLTLAWLVGALASANAVTQLAATALLPTAVLLVLGPRATRVIAFPLAFLFFAVPLGEFMMPRMIDWTADVAVLGLRASGIPVYREGTRFIIPSGSWSVVEACSGIRYLIASLMVGTLFGYLQYQTAWKRWLFVAFSLAVPIVANWMRAYLIVLAGHLSGNTVAVGFDHLIYGWLFFGLVVGIMFVVGTRWSEPDRARVAPGVLATAASRSANAAPRNEGAWGMVAAAVLLTVLPHLYLRSLDGIDASAMPRLAATVQPADGWRTIDPGARPWKPDFQNPSAEASYRYESVDRREVGVYLGYYRGQDYGRKLVSSDNQLVGSKDPLWQAVDPPRLETIDVAGRAVQVRSALLNAASTTSAPSDGRLLVWQLYWVADTLTVNDAEARILSVWDRLRRRGDDSAVIVIYSTADSPEARHEALASYTRANLEVLLTALRRTRATAIDVAAVPTDTATVRMAP